MATGKGYSWSTTIERAKVCNPEWLRDTVWTGLNAIRAGIAGHVPETRRDSTGEEQDELWIDVGRWVEAITEARPDLEKHHQSAIKESLEKLQMTLTAWPVNARCLIEILPISFERAPMEQTGALANAERNQAPESHAPPVVGSEDPRERASRLRAKYMPILYRNLRGK